MAETGHIFISAARDDAQWVEWIANQLRAAGVPCSPTSLDAGSRWLDQIYEWLDTPDGRVVLLKSPPRIDFVEQARRVARQASPWIRSALLIECLVIAWRVAAEVSPDARQQVLELVGLIVFVIAVHEFMRRGPDRHG